MLHFTTIIKTHLVNFPCTLILCYLGGTPGISYVSFQEACSNVSQTIFSSANLPQYLVSALEDAMQYSPLVLIMQVRAGFVQFSWGITFAESTKSFAQSIPFSFFVPPWGNQIAYFDTSRPDITQNTSCGWLVNEMQETNIFWNQLTPQYIPSTINPLEMNQCTPVTPVPISIPFSTGMFASIVLSPSMSGSCPVNLNFTLTGSTGEQVLISITPSQIVPGTLQAVIQGVGIWPTQLGMPGINFLNNFTTTTMWFAMD
jgi:hypothetical protein